MRGNTVWWILGGMAALAVFVVWSFERTSDGAKTSTAAASGIAIDPSTGGVTLPTGAGYGPSPLPTVS